MSDISLTSPTSLSDHEILRAFEILKSERVSFLVPGNHILLLSKQRMSRTLQNMYPYVSGISEFKKTWPRGVSFALAEKEPVFTVMTNDGQRLILDSEGIVLGEVGDFLPEDLVGLDGALSDEPELGRKLVNLPLFDLLLDIQKNWP